ncbi:MAG: hypothetical protein PHI68_07390, partial [Candidatus Cloacimonetes bacterium]|nr:hypothetical protein [Candidatus Cloacimonadota bacterium]
SLKLAGDNTVYGEGVFESSSGSYFQRETPAGTIYYEYAEGDTTATYNVVFSYVGYGMGDYEEYSTGKYRFVGSGLGSWLPQKRLMPPATRMNLNTILSYDAEVLSLGIEGLYGYQDKNTLSSLDDNDNKSLLLYAYARYKPDWDILKPSVKADYEEKSANSYLFAETSEPEADLSGLDTEASSAEKAQMQSNLSLDLNYGGVFVPGISYRLKRIYGLFEQNSLRSNYALQMALFDVKGSDFVMNLNGSHTLGKQVYYDSRQSRLQYHNLLSSWQYRIFTISADGLYNSVQYSNWQVQALSTRYQKLSPGIALSFKQGFSSILTYTYDQNDKAETDTSPWIKYSSSNTYNLRQNISTPNHTLELDASHRQVKYFDSSTSNTSYELVTLRSNHNFLKRAVSLNTNYQLNQNEFFPKIREFQYVGSGQGAYDADSTYVGTGDYDYVYLSGEVGQLSAEINGQLNLYIRPGYLTQNSTLRRFQTDLSFQATEQSSLRNDYGLYLFLPGSVYSQDHTIYGRQAYLQNLWIDLLANRLTGQLQYEVIRSLDQRYSDPYSPNALIYRSFNQNRAIEFNLRSAFNYRLRGQFDSEEDSRYDSDIENYALSLLIQRYLSPQTSVEISLEGSREEGNDRSQTTGYQMDSYAIKPALRSVWMQKYRLTASFSFRYNDRQGSEYLTFLRDKRQGFISLWNLAVIYKMNSFSTFSLEYSGDSYPEQKTAHQLRLEFKAEL